ncbi:IclR family transcriptional regulator [Streptomyces sp. NPDC088785]|uniref:IclR family transcriptional regulator n=1 Tax=Streptomyces sp. NPDC088785 TaxID=3365897 RepID=UPI003809ADE2
MGKPVNSRSQDQTTAAAATGAAAAAPGPVDKAMEVLSALADTGAPHRLADLARRTGLAKPTVHRLLRALAAAGYAAPGAGGSYRPGPRLLGLAAGALADDPALSAAGPVLDELRARTGLFASYAVRDGRTVIHLDVRAPAQALGLDLRPGAREAVTAGAAGHALLPSPPAPGADGWDGLTEADAEALRTALAATARDGYAFDGADAWRDRRALAAPVRDASGDTVGALVLTGLAFTLDEAAAHLYGPMLRSAAAAVSAGLAARSGPRLGMIGTGGEQR